MANSNRRHLSPRLNSLYIENSSMYPLIDSLPIQIFTSSLKRKTTPPCLKKK